jgi:hypothetical protein
VCLSCVCVCVCVCVCGSRGCWFSLPSWACRSYQTKTVLRGKGIPRWASCLGLMTMSMPECCTHDMTQCNSPPPHNITARSEREDHASRFKQIPVSHLDLYTIAKPKHIRLQMGGTSCPRRSADGFQGCIAVGQGDSLFARGKNAANGGENRHPWMGPVPRAHGWLPKIDQP